MIKRPIFKFLDERYVTGMLKNGAIRVATLYEFRDASKYGGAIADKMEGRFDISDFTCGETDYHVAKITGELPPSPRTHSRIESPDVYIFCATSELFSDTLSLSQEEGRLGCVMILDPIEFGIRVAKEFEIKLLGQQKCQYITKSTQRFLKGSSSAASLFEQEPFRTVFLKPPEFKRQREYRIVWEPNSVVDRLDPILGAVSSITPILVKVDISGLRNYRPGLTPGLAIIIHKKSGVPGGVLIFDPKELFSPVIFMNIATGELHLAFSSESRPISYCIDDHSGNDADVVPHNDLGLLFASNELKKIDFIELKELS